MKDDLAGLWTEYGATRSQHLRNRLVERYLNLVGYAVSRMDHLPAQVERADLHSYGYMGLIDAVEKFDAGRGVKFETYALRRIHGAILDGLRASDFLPRSVRSRAREVHNATIELETRLGRTPTANEIAQETGMNVVALGELFAALDTVPGISLDAPDPETGSTRGDAVADAGQDEHLNASVTELMMVLARRLAALTGRESVIAFLHYWHGMSLTEIGRALGVSESRICQIHPSIIAKLRAAPA